MNYRADFERCFEYIENHLKDHIDSTELAGNIGYSLFHFCRIFRIYKNMTPMEYVTDRRLAASLSDLDKGKSITEVALEYCFETLGGYTKAFKKKYGVSPSYYRKGQLSETEAIGMMNLGKAVSVDIREISPIIVSGYSQELDYESTDYTNSMAAFWNYFEENNIEDKMYSLLNPSKHGEIGLCITLDGNSSQFIYMLGVMAPLRTPVPGFMQYTIKGGKYAVFTTPAVDMSENDEAFNCVIKQVWSYIYRDWLDKSKYELDMERQDFELYDERCHNGSAAVMEIYVPVK